MATKDTTMPEVLLNYRCYDEESDKLLGTVDVELPKIEPMTETIQGAGLAGEVETTIVGHLKAMSAKVNFRTTTHKSFSMMNPNGISLTFRGSIQSTDTGTGKKVFIPVVVRLKGVVKGTELGKMEVGKTMGSSTELSVSYLKVTLAGEEKLEIDQYNFIYKLNGENYLAEVKSQLGEV